MARTPLKPQKLLATNLRKILISGNEWNPYKKFRRTQDFVPMDNELSSKIGISANEKVLVLAGCFGDWARELSGFCKVHYTDISRAMTNFAQGEESKVASFSTRPAELLIRRKKVYDWSFLFEPISVESMPLVFARSLLNNKGCKIVLGYNPAPHYELILKGLSEIYGANYKKETINLNGISGNDKKPGLHSLQLLSLNTTSQAREKALLDLKLLHFFNLAFKKGKPIDTAELIRKLKISRERFEESRVRIHKLALFLGGREDQSQWIKQI